MSVIRDKGVPRLMWQRLHHGDVPGFGWCTDSRTPYSEGNAGSGLYRVSMILKIVSDSYN